MLSHDIIILSPPVIIRWYLWYFWYHTKMHSRYLSLRKCKTKINVTFRNFTSTYARSMNLRMKKYETLCMFFFRINSLNLHFLIYSLNFSTERRRRWPDMTAMHSASVARTTTTIKIGTAVPRSRLRALLLLLLFASSVELVQTETSQ